LPDTIRRALGPFQVRHRARTVAHALAFGGVVFVLATLITGWLRAGWPGIGVALVAGLAAAVTMVMRSWPTPARALARFVEAHHRLDNLLVTAAELETRPQPVRPEIRDEVIRQALDGLRRVDAARVVPLAQPAGVAAAVVAGAVLIGLAGGRGALPGPAAGGEAAGAASAAGTWEVHVTPPAYAKRPVETHTDPLQVTALSGSRIRIEHGAQVIREWVATASASLDLRAGEGPSRFLSLVVVPDAPPVVRIQEPGRDTALAQPAGRLAIGIDGRDDLGLASLALRYTKASGGGENVAFTEGEIPLAIERAGDRRWTGRAVWSLDDLDLADGDVLVYRAIARDHNPGGAPVESDAFLVEIGRAAEVASAGFALPTEERKYAISQQMVIYKTEQLLLDRARHASDWIEQTRGLGVEQRMVRAEVVFLSGGQVEDEVEEAAHSHELAEGRHENPGRAEMVRALNFMSRAEAQLNDGNAEAALVFERQALASLERALDRRRYFLRTLPDRSRIDQARRLTGERAEARPWVRPRADAGLPLALEAPRAVMARLVAAADGTEVVDAALAARVAAIDPSSSHLQQAAVALAAAATDDERQAAARAAMQAITAYALARLPAATPVRVPR
jgi:hypothetical protein